MNEKESLRAELRHTQELLEKIEAAWREGQANQDSDYVIPEQAACYISMLLES